jgi:hypothetical protein
MINGSAADRLGLSQAPIGDNKKMKCSFFEGVASRVTPNVFLGSQVATYVLLCVSPVHPVPCRTNRGNTQAVASDLKMLRRYRITHILNSSSSVVRSYFKGHVSYLELALQDAEYEPIDAVMYNAIDFIEQGWSGLATCSHSAQKCRFRCLCPCTALS